MSSKSAPTAARSSALEAARAFERLAFLNYYANARGPGISAVLHAVNLAERAGPSPELARAYASMSVGAGVVQLHTLARSYARKALEIARGIPAGSRVLDVLQSVPILGFFPAAVAVFITITGGSALGVEAATIDISAAVDGLADAMHEKPDASRLGNIMARTRMITLFDLSAARRALPLGTGNKTERLFGYFTWHADDSPPVNPIGDLFKTQVWALARHLGLPDVIVSKPASADLITGQTDEGDFGISYPRADAILHWILLGYGGPEIAALGFSEEEIALVRRRLDSTHWKRRLPTVAMLSATAIGEYYLRPVDY